MGKVDFGDCGGIGGKWLVKMIPFLEGTEFTDETGKASDAPEGLRKVFDLKQQLTGEFNQF